VECHVFSCGHGDTVLLCLPGSRWLLVDCHLTKFDGTYDRFFDFLVSRTITRLEYIVLTHPDIDHFLGMTDVLEHFTSDGRSVGYWCDSGANSQQVREFLAPSPLSRRRYDKLQQLLDELDAQGKIGFHPVDKNGCEIGPAGFENRVDLVPIAPDPGELRRQFRQGVERLQNKPEAALAANPLSVVLVLSVHDKGSRFQLLLGADPEADGLATALAVWEKRANAKGCPRALDAVKVPHHGSPHSHCAQLCQLGGKGKGGKVAVVSAGMRRLLPERGVLADYLNNKWTLLITTTRGVRRRRARFSSLISKNPSSFSTGTHDIQLFWSAADGLQWKPLAAQVKEDDLGSYHAAVSRSPSR
jgi:beta-lactamase superfamily II metal-dependent hydrolase